MSLWPSSQKEEMLLPLSQKKKKNVVVAAFMTGRRNVVEMAVAMHCTRVYKECWFLSTGTGPGGGRKGRKIRPKAPPTRECRMNPATLSWVPTRCHTPSGQSLNSLPHPIWSVSKLTATPRLVSLLTHCHTPSGQSLNSLPHPIWSISKLTATPHLVTLQTHCHTPSGQSHCHTPSGQSLNSLPHPIWSVF